MTGGDSKKRSRSLFSTILQYNVDGRWKILTIMCVLTGILLLDMVLWFSFGPIKDQLISAGGITLFIVIVAVYAVGQFFVLSFIKKRRGIKNNSLKTTYNAVAAFQYVLIAIFAFLIFQMISNSQYYVNALATAFVSSYALASILMGLLSVQFFSWYRLHRNNFVLLYGLSSAAITVTIILSGISLLADLLGTPSERGPQQEGFVFWDSGSSHPLIVDSPNANPFAPPIRDPFNSVIPMELMLELSNLRGVLGFALFVLFWAGTAVLLRNYLSERIGRVKYWIVIGIPLALFVAAGVIPIIGIVASYGNLPMAADFYSFILQNYPAIFVPTKIILATAGILLGVALYSVSRTIPERSNVRDYLVISALGIGIFVVSIQSESGYYPPFGIVASSSIALSAYLVSVGIYSSAISASEDIKLRQSIKKSILDESKLFGTIASAQMELDIKKKIVEATKNNLDSFVHQTGIEPSITEDVAKEYIEYVLKETGKDDNDAKSNSGSNTSSKSAAFKLRKKNSSPAGDMQQ